MRPQENKRLIQEFYRALGAGDTNAVLGLLSDDVEWVVPGRTPFAGRKHGRDGALRFFTELERAAVLEAFDLRELIARDDKVVAFGQQRLRARDTGNHVQQQWAHLFTVREGRIAAVQFFEDTAELEAAFGESPAERRAQMGSLGVTQPAFSGEAAWERIVSENPKNRG